MRAPCPHAFVPSSLVATCNGLRTAEAGALVRGGPRRRRRSFSQPPAPSSWRRARPVSCTDRPTARRAARGAVSVAEAEQAAPAPVSPVDAREESLALLEWPAVSRRVAGHAETARGRQALLQDAGMLPVPEVREDSERLLSLTRDAYFLEYVLARPLTFRGVHDVAEDVRMTAKGMVLDGKKLLHVAETMGAARSIRRHIEAASAGTLGNDDELSEQPVVAQASPDGAMTSRLPEFRQLVAAFRTWPEVEVEIRSAIDDYGSVLDSCDSELSGLRKGIRDVTATIRARLNNLMSIHSEAVQERVISTRYDRFVISVKTTQKSIFKGVVHDVSGTGVTSYVEPQAVRALNDKLRELAAREKARVMAVLRKLSQDVVAKTVDDVDHFTSVLATIDAATARARASRSFDGVDVVFDESRPMDLRGVRHPLLSWKAMDEEVEDLRGLERPGREIELSGEEKGRASGTTSSTALGTIVRSGAAPLWKDKVVPADYVLEDGIRCVCVTGPNTGGKTISLKTLGIAVLLAKAGLFIPSEVRGERWRTANLTGVSRSTSLSRSLRSNPAQSSLANGVDHVEQLAYMPYFDHVLADIGDDQSLVQSLSTFSGHIQRIKRILCKTTANSLVLFDEIGSGTDPAEGAALGMALLRHLAGVDGRVRARLTFATTHHGELKTLKYEGGADGFSSPFENASVEFDDERMAPTFRLLWGVPGRSNALAIARRLGLHDGVVDSAEKLLTGAECEGKRVDVSKMVAELEREKRSAELARNEAETAWIELDRLRTELQFKLDALRASETNMRKQQQKELDEELQAAKKEIGIAIKEMQRSGGSMRAAGEATSRVDAIRASSGSSSSSPSSFAIAQSGEVQISRTGQAVTVDMIRPGYRVVIPRLGSGSMEVADVDPSRKEVTVSAGALRARVKVDEISILTRPPRVGGGSDMGCGHAPGSALERRERKAATAAVSGGRGGRERLAIRTSANSVDVRGERVEDAEAKVDLAISRAMSSGKVWIIHGHGTGRLRTGLRSFLVQHSNVERFEYAEQSEGGTGKFYCTLQSRRA